MTSTPLSVHKMKTISIRGAREHNLKNVNIDIPRDCFVVITGLSGSGKSSLAFDTIYAEGQRRYVESLSAYARQFLQLMQKPDVDLIEGLSPAISIEQKTTSKNPRSTVGTVTEIYDYLRLLFARIGVAYSPATGKPIESQTSSQMVDKILESAEKTRYYLLAPIVKGRKGEHRKELLDLQKKGYSRVKLDGVFYDIEDLPDIDKNKKHTIEVVVDRIVIDGELGNRLADSVEMALHLSDGLLITENADTGDQTTYSSKFACPESGFTIDEIEPRLFSFNNPFGACPQCDGLGHSINIDVDLVIPDKNKNLSEGAVAPWNNNYSKYYLQTLEGVIKFYKESMHTPFQELSEECQKAILWGTGKQELVFVYEDEFRTYKTKKVF